MIRTDRYVVSTIWRLEQIKLPLLHFWKAILKTEKERKKKAKKERQKNKKPFLINLGFPQLRSANTSGGTEKQHRAVMG